MRTWKGFVAEDVTALTLTLTLSRLAGEGTDKPSPAARSGNQPLQSITPVQAVISTSTPNAMRYHANGTNVCVAT